MMALDKKPKPYTMIGLEQELAQPFKRSPVVGVLCIDVAKELRQIYGTSVKSYIAASYVKYLEAAGARVVPIWIAKPRRYYEEMMAQINGVLIPGGAVFFDYHDNSALRNDCVQSSKFIYDIAAERNRSGYYFPLWGTCLGYQLILLHSSPKVMPDPRSKCEHMDCMMKLDLTSDFAQGNMFFGMCNHLSKLLSTELVGYHYHGYCFTKEDLKKMEISDQWRVLATNSDSTRLEFISLVEHNEYPFFGCQFHPERVCHEYLGEHDKCVHSPASVEVSQYFARFFVNQCRKSVNRFMSEDDEMRSFIWNFPVTYTGRYKTHWQQCYLFEETTNYPQSALARSELV